MTRRTQGSRAPQNCFSLGSRSLARSAGLIDNLKDVVDDGAIVETQLPIWGEALEQFGLRFGEYFGIPHWLAFQSQRVSC
jgi:hypothetical protein